MHKQQPWQACVALLMLSAVVLLRLEQASAQGVVGVVTAVQGTARLTRPATPTPVALRFKDGLAVRDAVDTAEQSEVAAVVEREPAGAR